MVRKILLLIVSLSFALVCAEIFARFYFPRCQKNEALLKKSRYGYWDPTGIHNIPNIEGSMQSFDGQRLIPVKIDSHGFRSPIVASSYDSTASKIIFVGDSITFGFGVSEEETFVARLRPRLRERGFEVYNAGVEGAGLTDEILTLNKTVLPLKPAIVVLCWYLNDNRPPQGFPGELGFVNPILSWADRTEWIRSSYLVLWIVERVIRLKPHWLQRVAHKQWVQVLSSHSWMNGLGPFKIMRELAAFEWGDAWIEDSMQNMQRQILVAKENSEKAGARFVIVAFPVAAQVQANIDDAFISQPQRALADFCKKCRIPFLDMLPLLRARKKEPIFFDHCHFSPKGHKLVADAILDFLEVLSF